MLFLFFGDLAVVLGCALNPRVESLDDLVQAQILILDPAEEIVGLDPVAEFAVGLLVLYIMVDFHLSDQCYYLYPLDFHYCWN